MIDRQSHEAALAGEVVPSAATRAFGIKGLRPSREPFKAAPWAVRNLCHLIAKWGPASPDAMLALVFWRVGRAIRMGGWVNELAPADWFEDIKYALRPVAELRRAKTLPKLTNPLKEIVPMRVEHEEALLDFEAGDEPRRVERLGRDAVPVHLTDPMWDVLSVMLTYPGAAMGIYMSPATPFEQELADATWKDTFRGGPTVEWQMYRGVPIRVRVVLYADGSHIPARATAEQMMISERTEDRDLDPQDRIGLRRPTVDCLKGFAMPMGAAQSIVHVPAAGEGRPVPGMKVLPPPRWIVPYDAPPKPAEPYRLGRCVDSDQKRRGVWMSVRDLLRHMRIIGSTGTGKSTGVRGLLGQLIDGGYGVMLIDPHGTLCLDLMGDVRDPDRIMYADFSDPDRVVPFNPLYAMTEAEFEARLQGFMNIIIDRDSEEYTGPRWRRCFGVVARGCRALFGPCCSLVTVFSILGSRELCKELAEAVKPIDKPLADQIWAELGSVSADSSSDLWGWLVCKGEEVLGSHALMRILGTGAHAFDLKTAIDQSKTILVNLGLSELGERSAQLVGCALVAELRQAMLARHDRSKPFLLFIDEAHLFQYGALPSLLDEARKFGVGVIVCHQRPDQLRFQLKDALSANAGSYIQLRTGNPQDAAQASAMLGGWPVSDLVRMRDLTGVAVLSRDGVPSEPFSIEFDFFRRHAEQLADTDLRAWREAQVRARSVEQLVTPYADLPVVTRESVTDAIKQARSAQRDQRLDALRKSASADRQPADTPQPRLPAWLA
jgi:hypothetical protein